MAIAAIVGAETGFGLRVEGDSKSGVDIGAEEAARERQGKSGNPGLIYSLRNLSHLDSTEIMGISADLAA